MSILIKGMEMPEGCFFCRFNRHLDPDTDKCVLTKDAFDSTFRVVRHRRDNCPLVPVPKHGRLIDADALEYEEAYLNGHYELGDVEIVTREDIESAPTIIPSEEGET